MLWCLCSSSLHSLSLHCSSTRGPGPLWCSWCPSPTPEDPRWAREWHTGSHSFSSAGLLSKSGPFTPSHVCVGLFISEKEVKMDEEIALPKPISCHVMLVYTNKWNINVEENHPQERRMFLALWLMWVGFVCLFPRTVSWLWRRSRQEMVARGFSTSRRTPLSPRQFSWMLSWATAPCTWRYHWSRFLKAARRGEGGANNNNPTVKKKMLMF